MTLFKICSIIHLLTLTCLTVTIECYEFCNNTQTLAKMYSDKQNFRPKRQIVAKIQSNPYLGSQCAILRSKLILVTNISHSSRISWTDGGGNAIAMPTMPRSGGWDFLLWLNEYCGRSRQSISTTCKKESRKTENQSADQSINSEVINVDHSMYGNQLNQYVIKILFRVIFWKRKSRKTEFQIFCCKKSCHTSNRLNQFTYRIMTIRLLRVNLVRWAILKITLTFDECSGA